MTSTIQSDITGKQISSKQSYKVSVFNRSTGTHIDFDCTHEDMEKNKILAAVGLSLKNGVSWYKLSKNGDTGKWEREEVEVKEKE